MHLASILAYYGIIIESLIIFFIILFSYILKFIHFINIKKRNDLEREIEFFIYQKIEQEQPIEKNDFKNEWKKIDILLIIISKLDERINQNKWKMNRIPFIKKIILPLARSEASNPDWKKRFCSAEAFSLFSENGDDVYTTRQSKYETRCIKLKNIVKSFYETNTYHKGTRPINSTTPQGA